jgi:hypothetical protein
MIQLDNVFHPVVKSKVYNMEGSLNYSVTLENQTHCLELLVRFDEEDDNVCLRVLRAFKVGNKPEQEAWAEENSDFGEALSKALGEWLELTFDLTYDDVEEKHQELFSEVWEKLEDENLV